MPVKSINTQNIWNEIQQQVADFKNGKGTVTRDALTKLQSQLKAEGTSNQEINDVLENYDKIDLNGDGVSLDELKVYNRKAQLKDNNSQAITKEKLSAIRDSLAKEGGDTSSIDNVLGYFDDADIDQDGVVSVGELRAYEQRLAVTAFEEEKSNSSSSSGADLMDILYSGS